MLILDPKRPDFWFVRLEPTDLVPPIGPAPDVDAAVRNALRQRTDLQRSQRQIESSDIALSLAKNATLPDLRVQATYLTNGLGGTELLRTGGFPGTVIGQQFTPFGDVLRQLFAANYPTWTVGFTLSYPLGRSADQSALARTHLERDQERGAAAQLGAASRPRGAAGGDAARAESPAHRHHARWRASSPSSGSTQEQKRFEVGMSTNFNVIQAQRDLAVARNNELLAQLDYQQATIAFETVQRVGVPSATTSAVTTSTATGATVSTTSAGPGGGGGLTTGVAY